MSSLAELKTKWFLDFSSGGFPPPVRHPVSQIQPSTDGNLVEPLIDGKNMMADFHDRLNNMITSADPTQHELWISSWRLDPVKLLGATNPAKDAIAKILEVATAGVKVYYLGSNHALNPCDPEGFARELIQKGGYGAADTRFPQFGSHHQKFNIFHGPGNDWVAVLGSADLSFTRWDDQEHKPNNPDRPPESRGPTHDVAVRVTGRAVYDIALTFTERWNDTFNRNHTAPEITTTIPTNFLSTPITPTGTHSVQVLRTYPVGLDRGHSWSFPPLSSYGEFTIWAAYHNAIKKATQYIYIEDQYFYSFNVPSAIKAPPSKLRQSDLVYQLGKALERGVDVVVLVPSRSEDWFAWMQLHQRGEAAHYLRVISDDSPGHFVICSLRVEDKDPVVHSKLMIVDDEFVLIGSANICQRSMSHDSEIHLAIVDSDNTFAKQLRLDLWQEHMELTHLGMIIDPSGGVAAFQDNAKNELGRLRIYPTEDPGFAPLFHEVIMNHIIDPYHGPFR